jgi:hypothetical protein
MMPTSSVSGVLSTSVYFVAVFLLMLVVMVPSADLYRGSSQEAAGQLAHGLATQVDALSPGMRTAIEFGSTPGMDVSVHLSGTNVTATVNGFSATQQAAWQLATASLSPGEEYVLTLSGGVVTLA